ncbi:hypothetical protein MPSEU_000885400 [Mayamaea pseudoterrestris]|nr:hypothetical protein MPSEU_000885400 [Mayamaea pseudoterrestris]
MSLFSSFGFDKAREELQKTLEKAGDALGKTGDVISKAATNAGRNARASSAQDEVSDEIRPTTCGTSDAPEQQDLLSSFKTGWTSVVEQTKASMIVAEEKARALQLQAEDTLKQQQALLEKRIQSARTAYNTRDINLPLDVPALKDAQVVYVTDRLIAMSHPAMASPDGSITAERKLAAVAHMLQRRHENRYMVWNLSEVDYDVAIMQDQVLTYSFPGSPSPPLGLMLKLLLSMESWLKADARNVAVVHCLTGKGRTSTVLAAFLCWMGEAGFSDIYDALAYIASCKQLNPDELTIPSQRRYASYFKNMLEGIRPSQPPLMLKRIIMSTAPRFALGPPREDGKDKDDETQRLGCAPYLQIFKAGKLLHTAPASLHFQQSERELPFCQVADGSIAFHVDLVVQGDILVRCRHLGHKQRISMFRAAIHTGYTPPKVMRLTKAQLDGACMDERFPDDFFLDLIFESVDADAAGKVLTENEADSESESESQLNHSKPPTQTSNTIKASAYDSMLHRDSRFWDVIQTRREEHAKLTEEEKSKEDPFFGATVGRRREFNKTKLGKAAASTDIDEKTKAQKAALETFSIGGELDFLPSVVEPEEKPPASVVPTTRKQDFLMDSLMAALDDEPQDHSESETIVFEPAQPNKTQPEPTIVELPPVAVEETSDVALSVSTTDAELSKESKPAVSGEHDQEVNDLLADADMDLDADMEGLLGDDDDDDVDDDLLDIDDAELDDLESFLSPTNKK